MVSMKEVRLSNEALKNGPVGLIALFVGATAGIGASTVKQFALHANAPTVYLAGRSQAKAAPLLAELKSINPQATFTFIEAEISLLKGVDKVCDEILAKEQKLDLLWLSQGLLSFAGQQSEFHSPRNLLLGPIVLTRTFQQRHQREYLFCLRYHTTRGCGLSLICYLWSQNLQHHALYLF
jgi:NAD(P)-dependent dehydrogenase (short-subunit alcohol dehydrogenase family)